MQINRYLNQTATREARSGYNEEGRASYSAAETFKCRFQEMDEKIETAEGREHQIDGHMWTLPSQALELEDKIVVNSIDHKIVKINTKRIFKGNIHHKKSFLQRLR